VVLDSEGGRSVEHLYLYREGDVAADHPPEYWRAVAQGLEAESQKAAIYVKHALSLGIAREAIFRNLIEHETPGPYLVKTGLIRGKRDGDWINSRQCDLLVYDPTVNTPFYRMDDFVVIPSAAGKVVVEVKSTLDRQNAGQVVDVWKSTRPLKIPTVGFAYEGVRFDTLLSHIQEYAPPESPDWPVCIAVHDRNHLTLRPSHWGSSFPFDTYAVNFAALGPEGFGMATAYFFRWYSWLLTHTHGITPGQAFDWFNRLALPDEAKRWIDKDGVMHSGNIPVA
jgi:hypothetical protein